MTSRPSIHDLPFDEIAAQLSDWGQPAFRARQVWSGIYVRLVSDPADLTDLPSGLRQRLASTFAFDTLSLRTSARSKDGLTEKFLLGLHDDQAIETVLMRYDRRRTACISTQVGCAMGCVFCATGQMGYTRHLSAGEIIEQVLFVARRLAQSGGRLTHVVVMGMGEPFHNYQATLAAIDRLNDRQGFAFGARRFTISTVGIVPMIERFASERHQVNLAVSLHAATDALRSQLLPINRRYPLAALMPACREYAESTGRRLTFEWALIEGINDGAEQAEALQAWVRGLNCHVNLIPLNPTRTYAIEGSSQTRAQCFAEELNRRGIPCTVRLRRGLDIEAGCGQLATAPESIPSE